MHNFRRAARDWLNCRYVPIEGASASSGQGDATKKSGGSGNGGQSIGMEEEGKGEEEKAVRPEMVNYFRVPNLLWFLVIPGGLGLAFVSLIFRNLKGKN